MVEITLTYSVLYVLPLIQLILENTHVDCFECGADAT